MDVVAPQTQPIVVSTGKGDYGRRDDRGGLDFLSLSIQTSQGHIQNQVDRLAGQVGDVAAATQRHLGDIGHRNGLALESVSREIVSEICGVNQNIGRVGSDIKSDVGAVSRQVGESFGATQRQAADLARELAMQEERNSARSALELEKRTNDIEVQAERNAAAAALAAATNTAALQAQIAKCCCEAELAAAATRELVRAESCDLKALVLKESQETRALITATETRQVRDALDAANRKLLALEIKAGRHD